MEILMLFTIEHLATRAGNEVFYLKTLAQKHRLVTSCCGERSLKIFSSSLDCNIFGLSVQSIHPPDLKYPRFKLRNTVALKKSIIHSNATPQTACRNWRKRPTTPDRYRDKRRAAHAHKPFDAQSSSSPARRQYVTLSNSAGEVANR